MDQRISSLNLLPYQIAKLENAGFYYSKDIINFEANNNSTVTIPDVSEVLKAPKSKTAFELYQEESEFQPVQTHIPELDSLLKRVIVSGSITELCGFPGTGKTQVCLHLAVGINGDVVFIHTNKNLNSGRLKEIAKKFKIDEAVMEKILCIEATNPTELMASVHFLESWLPQHKNMKLLIIDSITWPLKQQPSTDRSHLICTLFQKLRILANSYNFPIVMTNNFTTRVSGGAVYNTSSFGDSFYHFVNNRILLSKKGETFQASTLKSVNGCCNVITFHL